MWIAAQKADLKYFSTPATKLAEQIYRGHCVGVKLERRDHSANGVHYDGNQNNQNITLPKNRANAIGPANAVTTEIKISPRIIKTGPESLTTAENILRSVPRNSPVFTGSKTSR